MLNIRQNIKWILFLAVDLAIITAIIIYFTFIHPKSNININGVFISSPSEIAEFHFVDNQGKAFDKKNLRGQWSLLFFGFTHCPMVCPVTMSALNKAYQILQKELPPKQLPQIVFISVDPDRDTQEKINHFVHGFNPHFIGLRGELDEVIAFEKQLHVAVAKRTSGPSYNIDHSTDIVLVNPAGKIQAYFFYPHQSEVLARDYKNIKSINN